MTKKTDYVIGIALRNARRRRGLTQKEVAAALHTNQAFISKVETGKRRLRVSEAAVYNVGLGTTFRQLYSEVCGTLREHGCL